jgi:Arc/MetJ-type ribon-helix-helix transcriptional regulator
MEQKTKNKSRMISFRMPEDQIELLAELADKTGNSKSEVLRLGLALVKQRKAFVDARGGAEAANKLESINA